LQWRTARKTAEASALSVAREVHAATEVDSGAGGQDMLGTATGAFQGDRLNQLKPCVVPVDASSRIAGINSSDNSILSSNFAAPRRSLQPLGIGFERKHRQEV